MGVPAALDWLYSGRVFDAREALEKGFVQMVVDPAKLLDAAIEKAREMTAHSAPVSVALSRQLVWQNLTTAHPMDAHRIDSRIFQARGQSADAKEGITAFLEKRDSRFLDTVSSDMPEFVPWRAEPEFE